MSKIRWGIVGTGSIAAAFAHSIKYCQHSELIGVYGRNESNLQDFSSKFDIKSYHEISDLVTSSDIDAIYIATPHSTHYEFSLLIRHSYVYDKQLGEKYREQVHENVFFRIDELMNRRRNELVNG